MKNEKIPFEEALKAMPCPRCEDEAPLMSPLKKTAKRMAVYGCKSCGFSFDADGGAFVANSNELQDIFRAGPQTRRTLINALLGEKVNPATHAYLSAELTSYGLQFWYDGYKQGLLLGARSQEFKEAQDGEARS